MPLGEPSVLRRWPEQVVTLVAGLESVRLDSLGRLPPGRGPDSLVGDRTECADEVRGRVPSDATEMTGEEGVGALVDFGEPLDLGSMNSR